MELKKTMKDNRNNEKGTLKKNGVCINFAMTSKHSLHTTALTLIQIIAIFDTILLQIKSKDKYDGF